VKKTKRPEKYPEGGNLYLQVSKCTRKNNNKANTKSWLFRYSRFGKDTWLGPDPCPDATLSATFDLASSECEEKHQGIEPLAGKHARRLSVRTAHDNMLPFAERTEKYIDSQVSAAMDLEDLDEGSGFRVTVLYDESGHIALVDQVNTDVVRRRMIEAVSTNSFQSGPR